MRMGQNDSLGGHRGRPGPGQGKGLMGQLRARAAKSYLGQTNTQKTEAFMKTSKNFENQEELPFPGYQRETLESLAEEILQTWRDWE